MDITATDFLRTAVNNAEYFGFQTVAKIKKDPLCRMCKDKLSSSATAMDRRKDDLQGMLTAGVNTYVESKMNTLERPVLFYSLEQVPRSGEAAISLQIFGAKKSIAEAILIQTTRTLAKDLGFANSTVRINSLGDRDSTMRYTRELTNYLKKRINDMPPTARELMKDHVTEALMYLIEKEHDLAFRCPNPLEYLSDSSRKHFREVVEFLELSDIPYEIDPKLIGHHHCYSEALFTLDIKDNDTTENTLSSDLVIRGGRYNEFMQRYTKQEIPATGAVVVLRGKKAPSRKPVANKTKAPSVYVVQLGFGPKITCLSLIEKLHRENIPVFQNLTCDSLSTQLRDAESRDVKYTVIIGQKEHVEKTVILRNMHARSQEYVSLDSLIPQLKRVARTTA